jgi:hypothetical protein
VEEDGDIGTIEAAVRKMSRIIDHYSHLSGGGAGGTAVRAMAEGADTSTKEWLATMVGSGVAEAAPPDPAAAARASAAAAAAPPKLAPAPSGVRCASASSWSSSSGGGAGGGGGVLAGMVQSVRSVRFSTFTGGGAAAAAAAAAATAAEFRGSDRASDVSTVSATTASATVSRPATGSFGGASAGCATLTWLAEFGGGLSDAQREALMAVDVDALHSFRFDVLSLDRTQIAPFIVTLFLELGLARFAGAGAGNPDAASPAAPGAPLAPPAAPFAAPPAAAAPGDCYVDAARLWRFVDEVSALYRDVPYHNFYHCADVAHAAFLLIGRVRAVAALTQVECFALMVGALAHDMDHPGLNNAFLVASRHPLATTYNDASVLENRHVACLYALVGARPEADVFAALEPATWREVRRLVIAAVLHTDMTQHFPMVSKLEVFLELRHADVQAAHAAQRQALRAPSAAGAGALGALSLSGAAAAAYAAAPAPLPSVFGTPEERVLLLQLLLHSADISNPARPAAIAEKCAPCPPCFALGAHPLPSHAQLPACLPSSPMHPCTPFTSYVFLFPLFPLFPPAPPPPLQVGGPRAGRVLRAGRPRARGGAARLPALRPELHQPPRLPGQLHRVRGGAPLRRPGPHLPGRGRAAGEHGSGAPVLGRRARGGARRRPREVRGGAGGRGGQGGGAPGGLF